jgi:hypothetical protein
MSLPHMDEKQSTDRPSTTLGILSVLHDYVFCHLLYVCEHLIYQRSGIKSFCLYHLDA